MPRSSWQSSQWCGHTEHQCSRPALSREQGQEGVRRANGHSDFIKSIWKPLTPLRFCYESGNWGMLSFSGEHIHISEAARTNFYKIVLAEWALALRNKQTDKTELERGEKQVLRTSKMEWHSQGSQGDHFNECINQPQKRWQQNLVAEGRYRPVYPSNQVKGQHRVLGRICNWTTHCVSIAWGGLDKLIWTECDSVCVGGEQDRSVWGSRTNPIQTQRILWGAVPQWNLLPPLSASPAASASVAIGAWRRKGRCFALRTGAPAASPSSHHSSFAHGECSAEPGYAFPVLSTARHRGAPPPSWTEERMWQVAIPSCHQHRTESFC